MGRPLSLTVFLLTVGLEQCTILFMQRKGTKTIAIALAVKEPRGPMEDGAKKSFSHYWLAPNSPFSG